MNLVLNCKGYEDDLLFSEKKNDGVHYVFKFDNNYGASVVKFSGTYGFGMDLWELAVIEFSTCGQDYYDLVYTTPITDDVIGCNTDSEIRNLLQQIKEL